MERLGSVYIAGGRRNGAFLGQLVEALRARGVYACDWPLACRIHEAAGGPPQNVGEMGVHDLRAIRDAALVVAFLDDAGRSTYVEVGFAVGCGLPVLVVFSGEEHEQPALIQGLLRLGWASRTHGPITVLSERRAEAWADAVVDELRALRDAEEGA